MMIAIPEPAKAATFEIASWDYPDEYGNGIWVVRIFENSSGAWMHYDFSYYDDSGVYEWNSTQGIMLHIYCMANNTLVGAAGYADGVDSIRLNVTVTDLGGETVFADEATTLTGFDSTTYNPIWLYVYEIVLDFAPVDGNYYAVSITYELWW
jgi:hypothetical protein